MKRTALPVALAFLAALAACPPSEQPKPHPPGDGGAAPTTRTSASAPQGPWAAQAELVATELEAVVSAVGKGDKQAALAAYDRAYFERYECATMNVEVASQTALDPEPLDGHMKNVAQVREDLFYQIKDAVKHGAPEPTVRKLVDELSGKIRSDARKLDEQKIKPP